MNIVLNEYEWAEHAIATEDLGRKPSETLIRVAKYHLLTHSKRETRNMLDQFMLRCDPNVKLNNWSSILDKIIIYASKHPLINIDSVSVSKTELECIKNLRGIQLRRLAFTLLCVARYRDIVNEANDHWVTTDDKEIMSIANINTSIKRQCAMFAELRNAGLIQFSKRVDNLSVRVLFIDDGDSELLITDFRNLGYQYMKYYGSPFFECECCGITTKMRDKGKGRAKKYCDDCACSIHIKQIVASVTRRREMS